MELKQILICVYVEEFFLLIVPYGIETEQLQEKYRKQTLLIVPYGIETVEGKEVEGKTAYF